MHDADVPETEGLDQGLNDFVVGNRTMSLRPYRGWYQGKLFARDRPALITDKCTGFCHGFTS